MLIHALFLAQLILKCFLSSGTTLAKEVESIPTTEHPSGAWGSGHLSKRGVVQLKPFTHSISTVG